MFPDPSPTPRTGRGSWWCFLPQVSSAQPAELAASPVDWRALSWRMTECLLCSRSGGGICLLAGRTRTHTVGCLEVYAGPSRRSCGVFTPGYGNLHRKGLQSSLLWVALPSATPSRLGSVLYFEWHHPMFIYSFILLIINVPIFQLGDSPPPHFFLLKWFKMF